MVSRRYPRDRGVRAFIKRIADPELRRWEYHPIYGKVPLIQGEGSILWWRPDPAFKPRLPRGAVRGDPSRQDFCSMHHDPKYFYLDEERSCIQCGRRFIFRALEQKFWYETLGFNFSSAPIRCPTCRRQRRSEHALREQIARTKAEVRKSPESPVAQLALARAIVESHERTGQGNLDEAISAARRAARLFPHTVEPLFWEGIAHSLAGRGSRARDCLSRFIENPKSLRDHRGLVKRAKEYFDAA